MLFNGFIIPGGNGAGRGRMSWCVRDFPLPFLVGDFFGVVEVEEEGDMVAR